MPIKIMVTILISQALTKYFNVLYWEWPDYRTNCGDLLPLNLLLLCPDCARGVAKIELGDRRSPKQISIFNYDP